VTRIVVAWCSVLLGSLGAGGLPTLAPCAVLHARCSCLPARVCLQVAVLFRNHNDLLTEFTYFLPDNSPAQVCTRSAWRASSSSQQVAAGVSSCWTQAIAHQLVAVASWCGGGFRVNATASRSRPGWRTPTLQSAVKPGCGRSAETRRAPPRPAVQSWGN
jgi:histone deacetylase complex regulatory component SIN3